MKTILVFMTSAGNARAKMLAGVHEFAEGLDWNVQAFDYDGTPFPVRDLIKFWKPVGCIVEVSGRGVKANTIPKRAFGAVPVVYLGSESTVMPKDATRVVHDATTAAEIAAQVLLAWHSAQFAFVGMTSKTWSAKRKDAFVAALRLNGKEATTFDLPLPGTATAKHAAFMLKKWLLALEKPCGLFAADDAIAEQVLSICRVSDMAVPDEIAVISVDDNEEICNRTVPTLTSVRPDFHQGGRFAARLLARKMLGSKNIARETVFSISGITRRGSTRFLKRRDDEVAAALERIHSPSGTNLSPREILEKFPCSRRNAEMRFRQATGRSVLEELTNTRVALAKSLLSDTNLPISAIAERCGYDFQTQFRNIFRKATGVNPHTWRNRPSTTA